MSHSKNDFPIMGGTGRQVTKPYRGSYDAFYKLINPNTKKPYTNAELAAELEHRQQEYSVLAQLITPDLEEIRKKARSHPNAEFKLARRGKSRKKAEELLHQEAYPILERIAKLLFRPLWKSNLKCGNVTVRDYVHFVGDTLYADKSLKEAASLRSCINRIILPMIGDIQLHQLSPDRQKAIVQRLNSRLKNDETISLTAKTHTQTAYRLLFQSLVQNGYPAAREGVRLSDEITRIKRQNRGIINSCRENHLDDTFRAALFSVLAPADRLYDLWLVALIYTGLAPNEIPALCFGDIDQLELRDENCYTITVTKQIRDTNTVCRAISADNDDFPIHRLRRVVLAPWVANVMLKYIEYLHSSGYSDAQIADMRLSGTISGKIVGAKDIRDRINSIMQQAGIPKANIPRTKKSGKSRFQTEKRDIELLQRDAKYIAKCCGADDAMVHAMFGLPATTMDEQHYLDTLCDDYAVTRYLRLRRYTPFSDQSVPQRRIFRIENNTDTAQTIRINSNYAILASWRSNN